MTLIEALVILFWLACVIGSASYMGIHYGWLGVVQGAALGALVPSVLYHLMGVVETVYRLLRSLTLRLRGRKTHDH